MKTASLFFAVLALFTCGCATTKRVITEPMAALRLATPQDRETTGVHYAPWHVPAGDYVAAFRDDAGIYYQPPTPIICRGTPSGVFLFIGNDGRQGFYMNGAAVVSYFQPKLDLVPKS